LMTQNVRSDIVDADIAYMRAGLVRTRVSAKCRIAWRVANCTSIREPHSLRQLRRTGLNTHHIVADSQYP